MLEAAPVQFFHSYFFLLEVCLYPDVEKAVCSSCNTRRDQNPLKIRQIASAAHIFLQIFVIFLFDVLNGSYLP